MSDQPKPTKTQSVGRITNLDDPDASMTFSSLQPVSLHIKSIKSVGIENLVDVEVHTISRIYNSVSHYIKFYGGGEVRFSYNTEGELLEFSTRNVDAHIANGERIILRRAPDEANTPAG